MNKSYRVVWNASTSTWCAASEIARGRSKSSGSAKSSKAAAAAAFVVVSMGSAYAEESGAADAMTGDSAQLAEGLRADWTSAGRSMPATRMVVPDNAAYVKIDAKGDGSDNALAQGERSIAIGANASTRPSAAGLGGAVAIGDAATASGNNVALGANASALGDLGAMAVGGGANASGKSSIALGNDAQATGWGAYALGRKAKASAESALAIGDSSMATRQGTMALGSQAAASAENAIAIGQSAAARGADSIALGSYSESDRDQTVSVGSAGFERQVVNVGRGTQSTDAVNVAQLKGVAEVLGGSATIDTNGNVKKPTYTIGSKTYDNVGDALQAASSSGGGTENAVQYDSDAQNSVTLGGADAAAVKLTNVRAAALSAKSTDAVNGAQLFATNGRVTDIEKSLTDSGLIDSSTGESLAVVYDSATKGTVALGGTGGTAITNVKAGKIASTSKDAVNGGQLYGASSSIASALGGESAVNTDGTVSKPAYKIGDKTYDNVGDAIQAAAATGGAGGGEDASAVHYDGTNKSSVTLGGTGASKTVSLKNVATGVADTDAVNVAQLQNGLSDVKTEITDSLKDGSLDMKYIKVNAKGIQANALGPNSVAIGSSASATNKDTLAIGSGARASGTSSIAIGINSVATQANTVSVGSSGAERRIVNLGDGVDDNDAVNMKQLHDAFQTAGSQVREWVQEGVTRAVPKGGMTRDVSSKPGSFVAVEGMGDDGSLPSIASMNGRDPLSGTAAAIGVSSAAAGVNAIAVGLQSVAQSDHAVAIGSMAQTGVDQPYSVAIGSMVTTNGTKAIGIGAEVRSNGENSVAVGNNFVSAIGDNSVAIGNAARAAAGAVNSIAVGKSANVAPNVTDALALGANTSVTAGGAGGVALGSGAVANRGTAVSVGSGKAQRQIVNVAKGTQSTDAVNLSQLKGVTDALGGGSGIETDGTVTAPSYTVGDKTYNNVGDALAAMSESSGGTDPNAVAYDSEKKDKVTLAGENGTTLSNVKAGKVSADSKDAVNGAQLHDTAQSVADALGGGSSVDENGELTAPTYSLTDPEDESKQTEYHTVGDALENLDGRVAGNTTQITNIKNQFKDAGLVDGDGDTRAVVTYGKNADGTPNFKSVKLAGEGGTILSNVAAGKADMDAVNVSQLKLSGLIGGDGKTRVAVTYDKNEDGTANYGKATLAGEGGTTLSNVKAGKVSADSKDAVNGAQLHDTAQNVADALGGGSSVDENGKSTAPTYSLADPVDGTKEVAYHNVGDALENLDGRVAGNTTEITNIKNEFKDAGLVDGDGHTRAAVTYDKNADGTANYKSATLAGEGGTTLTNVKAGKVSADSKDAVNGAQLHDTARSVADALGGGSSVDESGKSTAPTYSLADPVDGTKEIAYHNVGDALENLDGRVAGNTTEITNIKNEFKDTGLVDGDGHTRAAVTYDKNADGTANYKSATLAGEGGTTLSNVADGKADKDAVNVSQLKSSGLVGEDGKARAAVTYDKKADGTADYGKATLAGESGTTLSNVADGKADKDAVNVSQLKSSGLIGEDGKALAAVTYDKKADGTPDYGSVTFGNGKSADPVKLSNIAKGTDGADAVNVDQLTEAIRNVEGGMNPLSLSYDDVSKSKATLAGENGTTLTNVKAGKVSADSKDAVNGAQLHDTAQSVADALGGGSSVDENGKLTAPTYSLADPVDGTKEVAYHNVGDALENLDGRVAGNTTEITNIKNEFKDAGLVDGDGHTRAAVTYDKNADGTANYGKATLAGENGTTLSNVADGKADKDAVNVSQLKSSGLVGEDGKARAAVTYDKNADGTANYGKATLAGENGTTLSNVADGKADKDAVNVSQLKSSGLVGEDGKARAAVTYDKNADGTADYGKATLAGENGTTLTNVKAGKVSADSKDAVNGAQLHDTAQSVADALGGGSSVDENGKLTAPTYSLADPVDGTKEIAYHNVGDALENLDGRVAGNTTEITNIKNEFKDAGLVDGDGHTRAVVTYDKNADGTANYGKATLAGENGTTLSNVADGKADKDAVNVSQLKSSGLVGEDGKARAAVTYDKKADGTADYGKATLAGENGTTLSNVKAGKVSADSKDAINGAQLHDTAQSVADTLGGGSSVDENGKLTAPSYSLTDPVDGSKQIEYHTVGDALENLDGRVAGNTTEITNIKNEFKDAGLVDGDGHTRAAVTYDKNADGTPNYGKATLAGENGTTLSNVKAGVADKDAVNVSQLKSSGLIGEDGKALAAVTYDKKADGTPDYGSVTFGNGKSADPVKLSNIAKGTDGADAVNVDQLTEAIRNVEGGMNPLSLSYDDVSKSKATLAGENGTILSNVKAGTSDMDAVNVSQLKSTGLIDEDGKARAAVMYDKNADGTPNYKSATLAGLGGTTLSNVADGKADKDAVNVSQLKSSGLIDKDGKALAAVTYDKNTDGTPNYKSATLAGLGGTTLSNVADGKADKDAVNVSQLKSTGLIGEDGKALAAVTYDKNLDGTPNFKSATLAGLGGTTLSNVKAGVADRDAVNVSQLKSSGLIGEDGNAHAAVTYDKNLDGTPNYGSVTLGGGKSEKTVMLSNVATGVLGTDAVNVDQLTDGLSNLEDKLVNGAIDLKYIKVRSDGIAARAIGDQAVAIGASANATGQYTMALGSGSRASGKNSVAIGVNSVADEADTVAVGRDGEERRIVHVKAGQVDASSTDAVNGSQLYAALDQINASVAEQQRSLRTLSQTRDVTSPPGSFIAVEGLAADGGSPNMASINGKDPKSGTAAAIGISSTAAGLDTVAVGLQSIAQSDNAVAIGSFAQTGVDQEYSVAIGSMVTTNGVGAIGIGSKVRSNGENSVAVGTNGAAAIADSSVVVGDRAKVWAGAVNGIAIGSNASVNLGVTDAIALGANAKALKPGSIAIGAGSTADRANAVSFGALGAERQLVNVAKGTVNTDAVNVGQLRDAMAAFGGNADIAKDGSVTAPTYTIGGQTYHDVEAALNAAAESGGAADPNGVAYDSVKKDKVTLAGQDGTTLTNLKAGDLTETSKDAVTGAQLFATNQSLDGLQQSLKDGGVIDSKTGESLAVTYESTLKDKVALAGQDGTTLSNVKAGTADMDAVNVSQLKSSGLIGEGGKSLSAVTYDTRADGTTDFASVTFGGMNANIPVALHNIAAGKASTDAVNVSQLKGVTDAIGGGAGIDTDGKVTAPVYTVDGTEYASVGDAIKALEQREGGSGNGSDPNAVAYDDDAKATVTLAGKKGTVIGNVAGGSLAVDSTEAVNGGQLNTVTQSIADSLGGGAKFDPVTGKIAAPKYELTELDGSKSSFGNVGDAFQHLDDLTSENVKQIEGLYKDVANAVQYDDEKHTSVTLGRIDVKPVTLKNVADGTDETDAVNVRQLRSAGLVDNNGVMQSAVVYDKNTDGTTNYGSVTLGGFGSVTPVGLHNVAAGVAATDAVNVSQLSGVVGALGGDAKIDAETGKVIAPKYHVGNIDFDNAGDALSNLDGRVKQIQNNITNPVELAGAVMYGKNGDGSVNYGMVKLGNGSGPVVLTNVKAGTTEYDAVNYGQLSELKGRVSDIDERLNAATTPGNGGGSGSNGNGLIDGTGGSGTNSAEILAAKPGTGNGNVAAGSSSQVADGQHNGTAVGAGSQVMADSGTAVGQGATVSADATNSVALGQGSKATEANTVSIGSEGAERRIVNIADGVKATDAVSKGQFDRAMGGMQGQINDLSRNAYSGIAAATALTMIPGVDPGKNLSFGVSGASYKGYQAVAMGGEARITENLKMRAGVGISSGGNTFGVGASYQW
uniref:YadA-like family protein n=2 Tax=Burkholderia cepacia TaxID=292 RepID=UPI0015888F66|nr:YadA-like family protein [Burkholderia cepacia]